MTAIWAERAAFPTKAEPGRGSGWVASREASRRSARSLRSPVRSPETVSDKSSEDEARATVHRGRSRTSILDHSGPRPGRRPGSSARSRERRNAATRPCAGNRPPRVWIADGHSRTIGRDEARRVPGRTETIDHPGVCAGRRMCGSLPYAIMIGSGRRTTMEGMS